MCTYCFYFFYYSFNTIISYRKFRLKKLKNYHIKTRRGVSILKRNIHCRTFGKVSILLSFNDSSNTRVRFRLFIFFFLQKRRYGKRYRYTDYILYIRYSACKCILYRRAVFERSRARVTWKKQIHKTQTSGSRHHHNLLVFKSETKDSYILFWTTLMFERHNRINVRIIFVLYKL